MCLLPPNFWRLCLPVNNGVVLSVEEVEGEMQGMRLDNRDEVSPTQQQNGSSNNTPGVLNQCFLSTPTSAPFRSDANMSAFDKLVNSMMASGTLPAQPNVDSVSVFIYTEHNCFYLQQITKSNSDI